MPLPAVSASCDIDSLFAGKAIRDRQRYVSYAIERARQMQTDLEFKSYTTADDKRTIIRHQIELQKKFTLSFACLIFFFIGAPLGAIIRKGGLGMPIVVSVFLFIFYYIIDTAGFKLARDGRLEVWQGIWASSAVLLPLGIFLTYKAVNDSDVFKMEVYVDKFKKFIGRSAVRHVEKKEVIMDEVDSLVVVEKTNALCDLVREFIARYRRRQSYVDYWMRGYDREALAKITEAMEHLVEYTSNSDRQLVINKLMDFPVLKSLLLYYPVRNRYVAYAIMAVLPIGALGYYIGTREQRLLIDDLKTVLKVSDELIKLHTEKSD